jgi:L-galactose dehydrogenase
MCRSKSTAPDMQEYDASSAKWDAIMEYRTFGNTGLRVSALGFGGTPLGGLFGRIDADEGLRAVRRALDLGVTFFDTSPGYGNSETMLGRALDGVPRESYVLSTKVGRYAGEQDNWSAERVARSIDDSLSRLRTDHIDLLLCHDIEYAPLDLILNETIPTVRQAREQGKVRFIGVSGLPLKIFTNVLDRTDLDAILTYARYTLADQSLLRLLPRLKERGLGLVNAAPLASGLLADQPLPPWHGSTPEMREAATRAIGYCRERGADISELGVRFSAALPDVAVTLIGMGDVATVNKNAALIQEKPDPELLQAVLDILAPINGRTWPTGLPENQD